MAENDITRRQTSVNGTGYFNVTHHTIRGAYPREFQYGVVHESRDILLSVNQYVPISNPYPSEGDITFVCSPGIGMLKETYEPLFEDTSRALEDRGLKVRGFWIADPVHMGHSAVLNTGNLGNDIAWWDHSRDILEMVQHFQRQMPRPIVGMAHSMGGAQLAYASVLHPNTFESIILIEAAVYRNQAGDTTPMMAKKMSNRREAWPDLNSAIASIRRNPFYKAWDPRAVDALIKHQFIPAAQSPSAELQHKRATDPSFNETYHVATTTPRTMETNLVFRAQRKSDYLTRMKNLNPHFTDDPHAVDLAETMYSFSQVGGLTILGLCPHFRSHVLYIVGEYSESSTPEIRAERMAKTGTGTGGNGGVSTGMVTEHVVKGGDHYVMLNKDHIKECCSVAADHLTRVIADWRIRQVERRRWQQRSDLDHQMGDRRLLAALKEWDPKDEGKKDLAKIMRAKLS